MSGLFTKDASKMDPVAQAVVKMREIAEKKKQEETPEKKLNETISFPNSSGQGHDDTHRHHPLHDTITKHGFQYSHSTPVHALDRTVKIHHTYAHGEHKVGMYAHSHEWDSKVSSSSGHHHKGSGAGSLDKHLKGKVKRYKLG